MNLWSGHMWWPIEQGWVCETCGWEGGLTWGLTHGVCRCDRCHTIYSMGTAREMRDVPLCMLKNEYKEPAKVGWEHFQAPISEWSPLVWDKAFEMAEETKEGNNG